MLRGLVCFAFLLLLVSCKIAMDKNNVFAALKTIYCRSDRLDVLGMINNGTIISPTVNKTLVVVLSSTRSKNITWNNFRTRFLDILDADLALAVSTKPENDSAFDGFRHHANYIWEIDDPPRNDYGYFYNEVSMRCFNHTFDEHYASVVGQVNGKSSGWLGCIHGTNQRACSGQIIFFRWFALQNILNDRLFEIYDKVVITRSDFLWLGEHCDISAIKRGQVGVPQHYDYGGLYDRHHVFTMYDAIDALDLLDAVIEREDPEEQKQWLIEKEFDSLSGNLESAMMCWYGDVRHLQLLRFLPSGMLVLDGKEHAKNTEVMFGGAAIVLKVGHKRIIVKYAREYHAVVEKRGLPVELVTDDLAIDPKFFHATTV